MFLSFILVYLITHQTKSAMVSVWAKARPIQRIIRRGINAPPNESNTIWALAQTSKN